MLTFHIFCVIISVLDLCRHVPLYRAVLSFIRSVAITKPLVPLLLHVPSFIKAGKDKSAHSGRASKRPVSYILDLLSKISSTVNTYISKLSWKPSSKTPKSQATPAKDQQAKAAKKDEKIFTKYLNLIDYSGEKGFILLICWLCLPPSVTAEVYCFFSSPTNSSFGRRVIYHSKSLWEYISKLIPSVCTTIFKRIAGLHFYPKYFVLYINGFTN